MQMTSYVAEIQRQLIAVYGFNENPLKSGLPVGVADGEYPMEIAGRLDHVRIAGGYIHCGNFDPSR